MTYLLIEDFREGLDTRRSVFTAAPGSLRKCENAHITRGGEIEKRMAFSTFAALPAGTFGLLQVGRQLMAFGSQATPTMPAGVVYQQLVAPNSANMVKLLSADVFQGKAFAVALYDNGMAYCFYDGTRVTAFDSLLTAATTLNESALALYNRLQLQSGFYISVTGPTITVQGAPGVSFTYSASSSSTTQTLTAAQTQAPVQVVSEVLATGTVKFTTTPDVTFQVTDVAVNGVSLINGKSVYLDTDASGNLSNPSDLIDTINTQQSNYTASFDGATGIVLTAAPGTGATPNGYAVTADAVVATTPSQAAAMTDTGVNRRGVNRRTVNSSFIQGLQLAFASLTSGVVYVPLSTTTTPMAGGVSYGGASPQVVTFTVGGTFDAAAVITVTINGVTTRATSAAINIPSFCFTFQEKMYVTVGPLLFFSGFTGTSSSTPDPTAYAIDGSITGAGVIDFSTQSHGEETLIALAEYQQYLAIFSEASIHIWSMDPDPSKNQKLQILPRIGTRAPLSVYSYGEKDVYFLAQSGVRSLRVRNLYNYAGADDVGTPVDNALLAYIKTFTNGEDQAAASVVDPVSGRFWLAIGTVIYVYSHFAGSGIAAWTTYNIGQQIDHIAVLNNRIYVRAGDTVFLYGGLSNTEYDNSTVTVELPYLDFSKPATDKNLHGLDVGCIGEWDVYLGVDPTRTVVKQILGSLSEATYGQQERFPVEGVSTHFSFKFVSAFDGPALLANMAIHYSSGEEE